ncbi:dihydroxyacetone kinase [Cryobacterium sp. MLB-32]|uniref:dihydroxyacetone kinase subunit DhaL n=1 Tax=Cryobacterium sp. MLB-32 TaxID=1529318 RepID=UPI0004E6EC6B|nr:dihydroxyacetone kinase subunit DhaL [Cryobacterium sp. MLB-32]KFF59130.1 dihydroxyacetone kinase [Cryobacterium sp. MLB-32]
MTLTGAWATAWIVLGAEVISDNRAALNTLDREIGDGDHGENMDRGFQAVIGKLDALTGDAQPADVLKLVATTLISTVGGAAGPLYGTAFLKAAIATSGADRLDADLVVAMLTAARDGIVLRGKAESGDKTMVDSWTPAVDAAVAARAESDDVLTILRVAAAAADRGAIATEPLIARKGRASYLGERAQGHRDPGAESTRLLLQAAVDAAVGASQR